MFWKGLPSCREETSEVSGMDALTVVPRRAGSGLSQVENNKVSQQNLKVNWSGVRGGEGSGRPQDPAKVQQEAHHLEF